MAEENDDRDELLLMRHLEGRLSTADTATLKARLVVEPELREKLEALELENDLITGAVSVPNDVELAEPVMMAIIDQAMKDPKRKPAAQRWWKPVLVSLSAAAAVVLAVLSIYMAGNENKPDGVIVQSMLPESNSVVTRSAAHPNGPASLLDSGAQILTGDTLQSAGGVASMQTIEGVTLHFDHNTRLRLLAARPHQPAQYELLSGAVIIEYQAPARPEHAAPVEPAELGVMLRTADGLLQVDLKAGRVLVEPLGGSGASFSGTASATATTASTNDTTDYLVYMPVGSGTVSEPAARQLAGRLHQQALTDGTQVRWPANTGYSRTVQRNSLVCDLLTGWQSARSTTAENSWTHELRYDGLDQAWPVEWATEIAQGPNFLKQAQALTDTLTPAGELADAPGQASAVLARWQEMSNALEDNAAYQQLGADRIPTWDMLAVKANLMAYRAARQAENRSATDTLLKRLAAHLRVVEGDAAKAPENQRLQAAAKWLRMESDLLDELVVANVDARYKSFADDFPTSVDSLALQLKRARLEPAGDARLAALNRAWQICHTFQVHLAAALYDPNGLNVSQKRWRVFEIKADILGAMAEEYYALGQPAEGDELIRTVDYAGLGMVGPDQVYHTAGAGLFNTLVDQAVSRANADLATGRTDRVETTLLTHLPASIAAATLHEVDLNNPNYAVETATAERWARAYDAWLTATGKTEAQQKFRDQAKAFLPAPTVLPAPAAPADPAQLAPTTPVPDDQHTPAGADAN